MSRVKGSPKTGGRKKGTPNKATVDVKNALKELLDIYMNPENKVNAYFDLLKIEDPDKRLNTMIKLAEFCVPKLNRTEMEAQVHNSNEVTDKLKVLIANG